MQMQIHSPSDPVMMHISADPCCCRAHDNQFQTCLRAKASLGRIKATSRAELDLSLCLKAAARADIYAYGARLVGWRSGQTAMYWVLSGENACRLMHSSLEAGSNDQAAA